VREVLHDEFVVMQNHFHRIVRLVKKGNKTIVPVVRVGGVETSGVKTPDVQLSSIYFPISKIAAVGLRIRNSFCFAEKSI
jgi:hypothetical protein